MVNETQVLQLLNDSDSALDWFAKNIKTVKEKFDGQFIAFDNEKVIAHDKDLTNLLEKLKKDGKDPSQVVIQFVSKIKMVL